MIVLLSVTAKPAINSELVEIDQVRRFKVPSKPKRPPAAKSTEKLRDQLGTTTKAELFQPDRNWAFRDLERLRILLSENDVTAIVVHEAAARPFAWRVAELAPHIPVLIGQDVAAKVLRLLAQNGEPMTATAVAHTLDPLRPPTPTAPAYLTDRSARPPLVVSIVENSIIGDSRVQKVARSLGQAGYGSVLLGTTPRTAPDEADYMFFGPSVALRLPIERRLSAAQELQPPAPLSTKLLGYRNADQEALAWERHREAAAQLPPGQDLRISQRARRRVAALRSLLYRRNRDSFRNREQRRLPHRWRAAFRTSSISRVPAHDLYPLLLDIEAGMAPILDELKPDAIHVHDPLMLGIAIKAKARLAQLGITVKVVFDCHEWTPGIARNHAYHVAALTQLERQHIHEADEIITVSDRIATGLQERFQLTTLPTVVTNAPPAARAKIDRDIRSDCGLAPETPLITYLGVVIPPRGVEDAVLALAFLPGVHLALISPENRHTKALLRTAKSHGVLDRFHRLDYVPADHVTSYIQTADIGLIPFRPLLNSEMGQATKFREYLLAGLPIVCTDLGLNADGVRDNGIGEICEMEDPEDLARAVALVLADPARYRDKITPQLRAANSWESQEAVLTGIYERQLRQPEVRPDTTGRLLIGALNSAGQGGEWARALRKEGADARSLELRTFGNPFTHRADVVIARDSVRDLDRRVQLLLAEVLAADTIIMESARPIAAPERSKNDRPTAGFNEMRALADAGKNVGMMFHGSDLRRPDLHQRTHRWSPFADPANQALTDALLTKTQQVHEQLARWSSPVMVSTADLVPLTVGAIWVPVVVDLELFAPTPARTEAKLPPVVVHMPSSSALKGTALIDPILRQLASEGLIRYRRVQGIPHAKVPQLLASADIFVDQMGMGIFGVAPLEAMASGAVVVTDPGPEALDIYGEPVPICAADPETLRETIVRLAQDFGERQAVAGRGRAFVTRHHDGRRSAQAILTALG